MPCLQCSLLAAVLLGKVVLALLSKGFLCTPVAVRCLSASSSRHRPALQRAWAYTLYALDCCALFRLTLRVQSRLSQRRATSGCWRQLVRRACLARIVKKGLFAALIT